MRPSGGAASRRAGATELPGPAGRLRPPPRGSSPGEVFAAARASFSFPEFLCFFLALRKAPEGKWVAFLQVIPGNAAALQSQLLASRWVEMSK